MALPLQVQRIVCPYDFTPNSREGLAMAIAVARAFKSKLFVLHVMVTQPPAVMAQGKRVRKIMEAEHQMAERIEAETSPDILKDARRLGGDEVDLEVTAREGTHEDLVIREYAETVEADLIVMASHGRRGLVRFFLGSTTDRVLRAAPCHVLIVRPKEARRRDRLLGEA